jgi:hypothetical protein
LIGLSVLAFVAPAGATLITLDAQVGPVAYTGGSATLDPIPLGEPLDTSNLGIDCLDGVCDFANQDWAVFRVSVVSGDVGSVGLTLLDSLAGGLPALGMGYFLGGGAVQDGTGGTDLYTGNIPAAPDSDVPVFGFEANGGGAGLTGSSLALFVAFADGSLPQSPQAPFDGFGIGAVSFMVEDFGGAGAASIQGNFATVIPEPGTALLLGLGLAGLCSGRWRKR